MVGKKSDERSPLSLDRARRRQLATEEGARTMVEVQTEAIAVRKNMERLRALRLAKEAKDATAAQSEEQTATARGKKPRR